MSLHCNIIQYQNNTSIKKTIIFFITILFHVFFFSGHELPIYIISWKTVFSNLQNIRWIKENKLPASSKLKFSIIVYSST